MRKKRDWLSMVIIALLFMALIVRAFHGRMTGAPAPDFAFERYEGEPSRLSALRGEVVVLDFWATWCPPCREEMPGLEALALEYEAQGVVFLAANEQGDQFSADEAHEAVYGWVREDPSMAKYAVFAEPTTADKYQVHALPTVFVIGRDGLIVASGRGMVSKATVKEWIDRALTVTLD